jgi:hypothetical protein
LAGYPKDGTGNQVEVAGVAHGIIVVTDGGAEDTGFVWAVFIGPGDDSIGFHRFGIGIFRFAFGLFGHLHLPTIGDGLGGGENLDVVVEFLVDGGPAGQACGDGVSGVCVGDVDGGLRTVAGGLETDHFIPACIGVAQFDGFAEIVPAIGMHAAVEIHRRFAVAMGFEDAVDVNRIGDVCGAFVVDDHIEVFGPIVGLVDWEGGFGGFVGIKSDIDDSVEAGLDAVFEQLSLGGVVMAATACDEENAELFAGCCRSLSVGTWVEGKPEAGDGE